MRPAFSSTRQAAAFALLLLLLLLAPALAGKKFLPPRSEIYSSIWWQSGNWPYNYQQIFQEKGKIDIIFIGSSHINWAINTPYVQQKLGENLGRPATVRSICWGGAGFDELFLVAKDLLMHRRVGMLVIDGNYEELDQPHPLVPRMYRFGDDTGELDGLPVLTRLTFYYASVVGMPRNFLSIICPNFSPVLDTNKENSSEIQFNALNIVNQLGAITARLGFSTNQLLQDPYRDRFMEYMPKTAVQPSDVCMYSPMTKTNFVFKNVNIPPMQLHFAQKLAELTHKYGCWLVVMHIPTFDERHSSVISEPVFWPDTLRTDTTMIGIPPASLFRGMTDEEIRKLFSNSVHFNENGQNYFTSLITPTLLKAYASQVQNP